MPHPPSPQDDLPAEMREVVARIRWAQKVLGWTLQSMASKTASSTSSWERWLNRTGPQSLDMVKKIAAVLQAGLESEMKKHGHDKDVLGELREIREQLQELAALWVRAQKPQAEQSPSSQILRTFPAPRPPRIDQRLAEALDELAAAVEKQWIWETRKRGLDLPRPIPVQWRWAHEMSGKVSVVANDSLQRRRPRFQALPGFDPATSASLQTGELRDLFKVYATVDTGRVVILGGYGRGKTAAAILTVLDALDHRSRLDSLERSAVPVPVLLTTHGWDPRRQSLGDWLAARLAQDYPFLRSGRHQRTDATEIVKNGHVALFLDGFDEMAPKLHRHALKAIRRETTFRLVVLTRSEEFAAAVSASRHVDAATLELLPVPAAAAASYLEDCQTALMWQRLIAYLREHPDGVLAQALNSPLNLTLLRDAFHDPADIDELLTPDRFGSSDEIEAYLLGRLVDVAYELPSEEPDVHSPQEAQLVLGYIAARMTEKNATSLAWWQIHHCASRVPRILAAAAIGVLVGGLVGALAFGPLGQYTVTGSTGTLFGIRYMSLMGLGFGLCAGVVSEFREDRSGRANQLKRLFLPFGALNLGVGLVVGLAVGLAVGNQSNLVFGFLAGLLAGVFAGHASTRVRSDRTWTYRSRWAVPWLRLDWAAGTVAGVPIGLTYGVTKGPMHGLLAGVVGVFAFGLMVGFSRPSAEADIVTDPQASWRRDRRHSTSFGITSALALALPLGIKNGLAHGLIPGVVAGVCFGAIIGLGCFIGASDTWRSMLLLLQLRNHKLPVRGMRFLEDARQRRILRTVGPLYQFRHPKLQERLAKVYQQALTK